MGGAGGLDASPDPALTDVPDSHRALALEMARILQNWPDDIPTARREQLASQLEKSVLLLDRPTRQDLAVRLGQDASTPLPLLAILFFDAPRSVRDSILARHAEDKREISCAAIDDAGRLTLMAAARDYCADRFVQTLGRITDISAFAAGRVLGDVSGECLAILCRGAGLPRLVFSTITMLTDASLQAAERKLELFDRVAEIPARRLVGSWRATRSWQRNGLAETPLLALTR